MGVTIKAFYTDGWDGILKDKAFVEIQNLIGPTRYGWIDREEYNGSSHYCYNFTEAFEYLHEKGLLKDTGMDVPQKVDRLVRNILDVLLEASNWCEFPADSPAHKDLKETIDKFIENDGYHPNGYFDSLVSPKEDFKDTIAPMILINDHLIGNGCPESTTLLFLGEELDVDLEMYGNCDEEFYNKVRDPEHWSVKDDGDDEVEEVNPEDIVED